ncbi:MAG: hypothetical protein ACFFDH_00180 [Promethearchaeota archaeon]
MKLKCVRCRKIKPIDNFWFANRDKGIRHKQCKSCIREYREDCHYFKEYRRKNKKNISIYNKKYYQENKIRLKAIRRKHNKKYYQENKNIFQEYYEKNKESIAAYKREWYKKNKAQIAVWNKKHNK